jgi:hypothetical protein
MRIDCAYAERDDDFHPPLYIHPSADHHRPLDTAQRHSVHVAAHNDGDDGTASLDVTVAWSHVSSAVLGPDISLRYTGRPNACLLEPMSWTPSTAGDYSLENFRAR